MRKILVWCGPMASFFLTMMPFKPLFSLFLSLCVLAGIAGLLVGLFPEVEHDSIQS